MGQVKPVQVEEWRHLSQRVAAIQDSLAKPGRVSGQSIRVESGDETWKE